MSDQHYHIRLYGTFRLEDEKGCVFKISSAKLKALIAILYTSPNGEKSRATLQDMLWGRSGIELGRASLRRGLTNLRKSLGKDFDVLFQTTNAIVAIDQSKLKIIGDVSDGSFLEGLYVNEPQYSKWLHEKREHSALRLVRVPSIIATHLTPAVCVIPFTSAYDSGKFSEIGDFLAMGLSRVLSKSKMIDVTSHLSCRKFDLLTLDTANVRQRLNIDYISFGSLKGTNQNQTLQIDLMDAQSERIIMSEDFNFTQKQIVQNDYELLTNIAEVIFRSISSTSLLAINENGKDTIESHKKLMAVIALMHQLQLSAFMKARDLLHELIRAHPDHSVLLTWLARWYVLRAHQKWSNDTVSDAQTALSLTTQALKISPHCSFSRTIHGLILSNIHHHFSEGKQNFNEAIKNDPNNSLAWLLKGAMHAFEDRGEKAVLCTQKARNLAPIGPHQYYYDCLAATAHLAAKDYEAADALSLRSYKSNPRHSSTLRVRTIALWQMGKVSKAQETSKALMKLEPDFTIKSYLDFHPATKFATGETWAKALSNAGVPLH